jgi:hypothetical protein
VGASTSHNPMGLHGLLQWIAYVLKRPIVIEKNPRIVKNDAYTALRKIFHTKGREVLSSSIRLIFHSCLG